MASSLLFTAPCSLFPVESLYFSFDYCQVLLIGHTEPYCIGRHYLHYIALCHGMAHQGRYVELRLGIILILSNKVLKERYSHFKYIGGKAPEVHRYEAREGKALSCTFVGSLIITCLKELGALFYAKEVVVSTYRTDTTGYRTILT